jgi:hypothetical protein
MAASSPNPGGALGHHRLAIADPAPNLTSPGDGQVGRDDDAVAGHRTLGVDEGEPVEAALGNQVAALGIGQLLRTGVVYG